MKKLTSRKLNPENLNFYLEEFRREGANILETTNQYEVFRIRLYDSTIVAYSSGKITYMNTDEMNNILDKIKKKIGTQKISNKTLSEIKIKDIPMTTSMKIKKESLPDLVDKILNSAYTEISKKSQHEYNRFKKNQYSVIIYKTGSIVFTIELEIINIIKELLINNYDDINEILIGQDEAGKGEWWGPMTIASVAMKVSDIIELQIIGAMDSKKLNDQKIGYLFTEIQKRAISMRVIPIGCQRFNELYKQFHSEELVLDDLLAWGHAKALEVVLENSNVNLNGSQLIIDEFNRIKTKQRIKHLVEENNLLVIQEHKADVKYPIVSIASICAKHVRNIEVKDLERKFKIKFQNTNPKELLNIENCEEFIKLAYIK